MIETSVVIVGGGIAGASMACALAHRHISSVLIERRSVPVDLNRGDGLQARSLEIMESWGALKSIVEAGALKSYGLEVHHPTFGKLLEIDLGIVDTPYPYMLNLPHQEIEKVLLTHARQSEYCQVIHGTAKDVIFEQDKAVGVQATIDGNVEEIKAQVIVGADGAQSFVRKSAGIDAEMYDYDHELLVLHAERPAWFKDRLRTRTFMHHEGSLVLIPLPENRMRIAILIAAGSGGEWKKLSQEELCSRLAKLWPALAEVKGYEQHGEHIYRMRKMHVSRYAKQGIVLVGDAAHLTHAAGGQGMNMALQDAEALAEELSKYLASQCSFDEACEVYEQQRRPLNQAVIERANFMSKQLWVPTMPAFIKRTAMSVMLRYMLPFVYKPVTKSLAWNNAGIERQKAGV